MGEHDQVISFPRPIDEVATVHEHGTLLETKLSIALSMTCSLQEQLDVSQCNLHTAQEESQRNIGALVESHEHDLEIVHTTYSACAHEYENRKAELLRLRDEAELSV